ncbi:16S rRNA (guanine(527)-N(7))-methyltransferase RsmG [Undibacterium rugosum]|uniref:Ribosomal RNA small subunit methyltransferase G n=1 Tax=Undibacterium rugosum TaxID=2762291 RepID=A0A923I055_9BURK|nr:16S rRNA (guanine(527)-N(7))-methyltransferase RsmG [Undibacterium rugosum]MBC3934032.1 16S rRNA (guanine(527)-N(7))-methyltransferase RsmG [Undibacterium rugosum]MBR7780130.1 16S rRNA (guanine(527)-N(7))-methyltransferase RsmG [Undibacterium rugosum]
MAILDTKALKASLSAGVQEMGLTLTEAQIDQMLAYLALLSKWNAVYNLTAIRDPQEMVKQHLLDSLSAAPAFVDARNVLDVGAGGGLPGMMLAIAYPQTRISMIDTVSKKTAFLSQAKAELGLSNVTVFTGRVEQLEVTEKFDVITSRAFSELCNFINWSGHLLAEGGQFIAMKGVAPAQEIERLPAGWAVTGLQPLQVPGLNAERHLVFVRRTEQA